MKTKFKCGVVAGITMLSFSLSCMTPTFAECDKTDLNCSPESGDTMKAGGESEVLAPQNVNSVVDLSSVSVEPTEISVAIGEEKHIVASYNSGFDTANLDAEETNVAFASGDDEWVAYTGFEGEYDGETFQHDFNSIYVYGNNIGTAVYTVTATDTKGNEATTTFTVTVRQALGYGYDDITFEDEEGWTQTAFEAGAKFTTPVEGGNDIKLAQVPMTADLQALDPDMKAVLDVVVIDKDGNVIPVENNDIEMWFGINKAKLAEAYQYFQIAYIKDGKIVAYIDVTNIEDDGWGYMLDFGTSHLSSYAILASNTPFESADSRNAKLPQDDSGAGAPNTGAFTGGEEASLMSNSGLIATITVLSLVLAVYGAIKYAKQ